MRSRRLRGVAVTLLVVACAAAAEERPPGPVRELAGRSIVGIEFDCAEPIDQQALLQILPFRVNDPLRAQDLEQARWRLTQTGLFTTVSVEVMARGTEAAVILHLRRKAIVNAVRFYGNHALGDEDLRHVVRLHGGTPLTDELRDEAVTRVRERYVAEGFEAVQVAAVVRIRTPGEVDVAFQIEEGDPLRISAIAMDAPLPLAEKDIRKAFGLDVDDRYARAALRKGQTAVVQLLRREQYFEAEVNTAWERGDGNSGVLRLRINPGALFRVEFAGNHHFSDAHLLELMDLPTRPIVTDGTWRELARRAQRAYQEAGYYFAHVELHLEPGSPKVVHFEVTEGQTFRIDAVAFEGNHGLSVAKLREPMATRPPSWVPWRRGIFLDDVFNDDLKRLWYLYRRSGFASAEIVDARTAFDAQRGRVVVMVVIEEGLQTVVRDVVQDGMGPIADRMPKLQVGPNLPLDPEQVDADRRALVTAFARAGYTHAEVTADVTPQPGHDRDQNAATVRFSAVAGAQEHVGTILVQNNFDTRARVIVRELPFTSGEPLDPDALLRGQSNIYRLGLFRSVTVRPLEAGDASAQTPARDVAVSVSEKPPGTMQWGAGYNTRDGFRGFVEVAHNNLQGLARRLSLRGEFNVDPSNVRPNDYIGNLAFREPRLADTLWTFRTNLIAQRSTRSVDQFSLERFALIPAIERTLLPGLQVGVEAQLEQSQVFDVKPDVLAAYNPDDEGRLREISAGPFIVYDGRDDSFAPRRGVFDSLRIKFAPRQFGSDIPLIKLIWQHSHYIPLDNDLTFVYAIRGGWGRAYDGDDKVPIRERFFLGGRTTVRGFGENSIGPQGTLGNPIGGDFVLNLNTEVRVPLVFGLSGAVFVDGGGVYLQERAMSMHDFRRTTGVGLRYLTPVGPISLDYGFKLDRRSDESLGEVHFSIGTIF